MKKDKIDDLYLQLLASWGDSPIDEEEVKRLLADFERDVRADELGKFEAFVNKLGKKK
jgi:hypothetical protein